MRHMIPLQIGPSTVGWMLKRIGSLHTVEVISTLPILLMQIVNTGMLTNLGKWSDGVDVLPIRTQIPVKANGLQVFLGMVMKWKKSVKSHRAHFHIDHHCFDVLPAERRPRSVRSCKREQCSSSLRHAVLGWRRVRMVPTNHARHSLTLGDHRLGDLLPYSRYLHI